MKTVWVSPVWTVEGWGQSADRAPFVEEFLQWKAEDERLQKVLDKLALTSLVEPRGLLEVSESSERRLIRRTITAAPLQTPEGGTVYNDRGEPELETDDQGEFVEAEGDGLAATVVVDQATVIRSGPAYRILPYRDSLVLPGHARDEDDIWGYAKRFWKRLADLQRLGKDGVYDAATVNTLTEVGDRESAPALDRSLQSIAPQQTRTTAEKELWEALILVDLNSIFETRNVPGLSAKTHDGARWYVATVHLGQQQLLRFQFDDVAAGRYLLFNLYPRPDRAGEGYSFVGHKLVTTTEEHTAYRNMAADRCSMAVNAPITKLQGALWDEDEQPWGPKAVVTVRSHQEIQAVVVPDVPVSVYNNIERCERTAERLAGVNDVAAGQVSQDSRTLGEVQMATEQSFVRMDGPIRRFQETMEELGQIRLTIWQRVLAERPDGMEAPSSVMAGLEGRGLDLGQLMPNGRITANLIEGTFRFKPLGSIDTANPMAQRADFMWMMQALPLLLQAFPALAPMLQTPQAARAIFRQFLRVGRIPNPQAFLGSPSQDLAQQSIGQLAPMLSQMLGMPPMGQAPMPPGNGGPNGEVPMPPLSMLQ